MPDSGPLKTNAQRGMRAALHKSLFNEIWVYEDRRPTRNALKRCLPLSGPTAQPPLSRYRVALCLLHLCFSGISGHRAVPPQICHITAEERGWQEVSQLKLHSGGYRAILCIAEIVSPIAVCVFGLAAQKSHRKIAVTTVAVSGLTTPFRCRIAGFFASPAPKKPLDASDFWG